MRPNTHDKPLNALRDLNERKPSALRTSIPSKKYSGQRVDLLGLRQG